MQKSNRGIILVFLIILGVPLGFFLYGYFTSDTRMYQDWGFIVPSNFKKQYSVSETGGTGDRETYEIYALNGTDTQGDAPFLEKMSSQKSTEMQEQMIAILKILDVDTQKYPNFSHDYQWKVLNKSYSQTKLYIVFDTKLSLIYLVQDIWAS
ncbi:hypothetical protein CAFE_00810 [Caprobacter fermentans]|uniref:Uncharacterized protein n=1 Tax=Caproicibacter fermentans TaxID=2576756 RepID=A0A6N8HV17_9FIRM|nr:hypothetical protein [Caproicibacter fermentans]MVB09425.1 hypothetical protein [Caproicibacter fermentans]QNK41504.1 hypothetical protein HCR03_04335 [Caproicibacter fermentans]